MHIYPLVKSDYLPPADGPGGPEGPDDPLGPGEPLAPGAPLGPAAPLGPGGPGEELGTTTVFGDELGGVFTVTSAGFSGAHPPSSNSDAATTRPDGSAIHFERFDTRTVIWVTFLRCNRQCVTNQP